MKPRTLRIFGHVGEGVDAVVLMNGQEPMADMGFFYASGISSGLFEDCPIVLWPDGRSLVLTSSLEEQAARSSSSDVAVFSSVAERDSLLAEALKGAGAIGLNAAGITWQGMRDVQRAAPSAQLVDVGPAVQKARTVKGPEEIESIREACRIASRAADAIPDMVHEGMAETEAAAEIARRMQSLGASSLSFDTIAAFGPGSAEPHWSPGPKRLAPGELALFDFGCRFRRYCSDITRTFVCGRATEKLQRMHDVVQEAQGLAMAEVRAGAKASDVDAAARGLIDSTEFRGRFIHSTGHGLGLSVHDGGRFSKASDLVLEEGMVMTVEPGVYLPGIGGVRIEDDVLVTKSGCQPLTGARHGLQVI